MARLSAHLVGPFVWTGRSPSWWSAYEASAEERHFNRHREENARWRPCRSSMKNLTYTPSKTHNLMLAPEFEMVTVM